MPKVSVIVAARNEAGNIENVVRRTPELGGGTELIFVEGGSRDNTYEAIEKTIDSAKDYAGAAELVRKLMFLQKLDAEIDLAYEELESG